MKLHIGGGTIYLDGWVNVELRRPFMHLAKDRPDLVESLRTTEDRYYARHDHKNVENTRKPEFKDGVCDLYGSAQDLPVDNGTAEEILLRQVFEHFSLREARDATREFQRALRKGGLLRLDVPDHDATVKLLMETKDEFYFRHLFGSRKDEYGYHLMSYTRDGLAKMLSEEGFDVVGEEENIHFYPAFCLRARKL